MGGHICLTFGAPVPQAPAGPGFHNKGVPTLGTRDRDWPLKHHKIALRIGTGVVYLAFFTYPLDDGRPTLGALDPGG